MTYVVYLLVSLPPLLAGFAPLPPTVKWGEDSYGLPLRQNVPPLEPIFTRRGKFTAANDCGAKISAPGVSE